MHGKAVVCEVAAAHARVFVAIFTMIDNKFTYAQLGSSGGCVRDFHFVMAVAATAAEGRDDCYLTGFTQLISRCTGPLGWSE